MPLKNLRREIKVSNDWKPGNGSSLLIDGQVVVERDASRHRGNLNTHQAKEHTQCFNNRPNFPQTQRHRKLVSMIPYTFASLPIPTAFKAFLRSLPTSNGWSGRRYVNSSKLNHKPFHIVVARL
jgi:hypothetical protein